MSDLLKEAGELVTSLREQMDRVAFCSDEWLRLNKIYLRAADREERRREAMLAAMPEPSLGAMWLAGEI